MSESEASFQCFTCGIMLNAQGQFDDHMAGKSHLKKLKKALEEATSGANTSTDGGSAAPVTHSYGQSTSSVGSYGAGQVGYDYVDPPAYVDPNIDEPVATEVYGTKRKLGLSNYPCAVCDLEFNSDFQAQEHFKGAKHAKKLKVVEEENKTFRIQYGLPPLKLKVTTPVPSKKPKGVPVLTSTEGLYCSFCDMYLNSAGQLDAHRQGNKHLANLQKLKDQSGTNTATTTVSYNCAVCNVSLYGAANYKKHMVSPEHKKQENLLNRTEPPSDEGQTYGTGTGDDDGGPGDFPPQDNIWAFASNIA